MSCNDHSVRIQPAFCFFPFPIINKSFATDGTLEILEEHSSRCDQIEELNRQYCRTFARHLDKPAMEAQGRSRTETLARFSVDASLAMMRPVRGSRRGLWKLPFQFAALGPIGWYVFLRDSRIAERVAARIRASFGRPRENGDSQQDKSKAGNRPG